MQFAQNACFLDSKFAAQCSVGILYRFHACYTGSAHRLLYGREGRIKSVKFWFTMAGLLISAIAAAEGMVKAKSSLPPSYFPNTEELRADEMRIIALGTGLPTPTTRAQKSTAWMVELGNGDIFIFDIGSGSMENLFGLRPNFSKMDKIFLSHLHSDHFGDLDAFIVGSWLSGRYWPLHVYGGSGETPELGTKAAVDHLVGALAWDIKGHRGTAGCGRQSHVGDQATHGGGISHGTAV